MQELDQVECLLGNRGGRQVKKMYANLGQLLEVEEELSAYAEQLTATV